MRFLADIPDDDVKWLDRKAAEEGKSRAALLREAVAAYRAEAGQDWLDKGFGLWATHGHAEDGLTYERRLRDEWSHRTDTGPTRADGGTRA